MRRRLVPVLLAAAAVLGPRAPGAAQEVRKPVVEGGIAGGGGWLPDYPAAGQNHVQAIPFPYLIYRGEVLRSDHQGVRGRFLNTPSFGLDLSFSGAFPSSSSRNRAREGMPDLDWQGEVGPALRLTLWRDPEAPRRVNLEVPVRAVFSSDLSSVRYRGVVLSPELAFQQQGFVLPAARLRVGVGPVFATNRLMDYFYRVEPRYGRPGRPAYEAGGGYLGTRLQFSLRVPVGERVSVVGGGRVENFSGAANEDSPLFRRNWNLSLALGLAWSLYRSEATVSSAADPFD